MPAGASAAGVRLVAPGQQLLELVLVPGVVPTVHQLLCAVLHVLVQHVEVLRTRGADSLDGLRVAAQLRAPLVEDTTLLRPGFGRAEAVPLVGVLSRDPQRHLLAGAADEDRDRPVDWLRLVLLPALLDDLQAVLQLLQAAAGGAKIVAKLVIIA